MRRFARLLIFIIIILLSGGSLVSGLGIAPSYQNYGENLNGESGAQESHSLIVEPGDGKEKIISLIGNAHDNLTLTIYELTDPDIIAALASARERNVSVRVIYNNNSFASMKMKNPNEGAVFNLSLIGAGMKPASPNFTVTHQKTLTVDGSQSLIMTFNLEPGYFNTTRDFGIFTTNLSEVLEITEVFDADWNYSAITPSLPSLVWSPVNSRTKILGVIEDADKSLDVYNEEINDKECIAALAEAAKRGVTVRVIAADLRGDGQNENAPALATLNSNGVQAKSITSLYIHAKMILADYGTPDQIAFIGSENFGHVSLDQNRELGILVAEKPILDRLESVFDRDWKEPANAG